MAAARFVEQLVAGRTLHVVLAGDFDAVPDAASVRFWSGRVRCGDHGPTLYVSACNLAFAEPRDGVWASDHFGLVADLAHPSVSRER